MWVLIRSALGMLPMNAHNVYFMEKKKKKSGWGLGEWVYGAVTVEVLYDFQDISSCMDLLYLL